MKKTIGETDTAFGRVGTKTKSNDNFAENNLDLNLGKSKIIPTTFCDCWRNVDSSHYTPETKEQSIRWIAKGDRAPKKAKTVPSAIHFITRANGNFRNIRVNQVLNYRTNRENYNVLIRSRLEYFLYSFIVPKWWNRFVISIVLFSYDIVHGFIEHYGLRVHSIFYVSVGRYCNIQYIYIL